MILPRTRLLLLLIDVALVNIAFVAGYVLRYRLQWLRDIIYEASFGEYALIQLIFTITMIGMFWLDGVYAPRRAPSWTDQMFAALNATIKSLFILWALIFLIGPTVYSRLMMIWAGAAALVLIGISRFVRGQLEARLRKRGLNVAHVLIVGAGELGRTVMRNIMARPELGYRVVGFVDDDEQRGHTDIGRFAALGEVSETERVLTMNRVDEVIITLPWSAQPKIVEVVNLCNHHHIRARVVPSLLQINLSKLDVDDLGGIPLIGVRQPTFSPVNEVLKRGFDLLFGGLVFLMALPVMTIAALLIRADSPGSPIFSQPRAGKDGKPFKIYKLRSMVQDAEEKRDELLQHNEADGPMFKIKDDPRTTRVGRIIRKLSLDELPQFWNVLKGDMSVVGPRPALLHEVAQYGDWHNERLRVKPGISGLWQISGRSELTFDEMCLLDVYYIENWSLSLDLKIALKTVPYLLSARGAY
jgi:exopolysaccharide biosynthesis polyprenyl glycosylphosphotransferase